MITSLLCCMILSLAPSPEEGAYLKAHQAEVAKRYSEAINDYRKCAQLGESLAPYARVRIAVCLEKTKQSQAALDLLGKLVNQKKTGPWTAMALAYKADLLKKEKDYAGAAPLYDQLLSVAPIPWWMEDYSWRAAETWLKVDNWRDRGFAYFNEVTATTIYSYRRRDAARLLLTSPKPEDRLVAILGLLRASCYTEAGKALKENAPPLDLGNGETLSDPLALLLSKNLTAGETKTQLEQLIAHNKTNPWWPLFLIYSMRTQAGQKNLAAARALCDAMVALNPEAREAGEALWWMAQHRLRDDKPEEAALYQDRLPVECPEHYRADDALYATGNFLLKRDQQEKALKAFQDLGSHYLDSRFRAQALYRSATIYASEGKEKQARLAYTQAANQSFGRFYGHRAQEQLFGHIPLEKAGLPNLRIDGTHTVLRTFRDKQLPPKLHAPLESCDPSDAALVRRLRFFGFHGMEAGEWEALHLLRKVAHASSRGYWYLALAECGFSHTSQQFADARHWGYNSNGKALPERLRLEYPRPYWPLFKDYAKQTGLDPYLLLALARQESTFRASVRSSAGATGVMQIMPATAKWMAKVEPAVSHAHVANLTDPHNSIRLGAYYLMRMVESRDGHLIYALASYNAGPGNCNKWRKRWPNVSLDSFIDRIPFHETQGYVKKVLGNYAAYRSLYPLTLD